MTWKFFQNNGYAQRIGETEMIFTGKKAFTLIELLVVIAIIASLTAILMPALAAARQQGKQVVCKSNIRQLVIANTGYAIENDGFYVLAASDFLVNFGGFNRWHGVRTDKDLPFDPAESPLLPYIGDGQVKQCPCKVRFITDNDWDTNFEHGGGGYGYNMFYIGSRLWQASYKGGAEAYEISTKISEVANPSQTVMFADSAFPDNQNSLSTVREYSFIEQPYIVVNGKVRTDRPMMLPSIHFRHRKRANAGWADGHVDSRKMADMTDINADSAKLNIGWFDPVDNSLFDLK